MKSNLELTYYLGENAPATSVNPLHGDVMTNIAVTQQLVSTLVVYSSDGVFSPLASKSWSESPDGKILRFTIRDDIFSEVGDNLDADFYVRGLLKLLRIQLKKSDLPDFNLLEGWEDFRTLRANFIKGINIDSKYVLSLHFTKRPTSILKYLSMPKFGFVYERDFIGDEWKDDHWLTSTGPYKISNFDSSTESILIEKNLYFKNDLPRTPTTVRILKKKPLPDGTFTNSIAFFRNPKDIVSHGQGNLIHGPPVVLTFMALSPKRNLFSNLEVRSQFSKKIFSIHNKNWDIANIKGANKVSTFFLSSVTEAKTFDDAKQDLTKNRNMKIIFSSQMGEDERSYNQNLIESIVGSQNLEIINEDRTQPDWLAKQQSYLEYDIRIASVSTGGIYLNWVVKMMFCGKIGVGLPDELGSVCKLVNAIENNEIDESLATPIFEKMIRDEAQVIPLYYYGISWLISKNISISQNSQLNYYPIFNQVEIGE